MLDRIADGRQVSIEREDVPGAWSPTAASSPCDGDDLLDRHRHARDVPPGPARPDRGARAASRVDGRRRRRATVAARRHGACARSSAPTPSSRRAPASRARSLLAGAASCGPAPWSRARSSGSAPRSAPAPTSASCSVVGDGAGRGARRTARRREAAARLPVRPAPCAPWSRAAPASSARRSSTACWPRATRSTCSTTCQHGLARQPRRRPRPSAPTGSRFHQIDIVDDRSRRPDRAAGRPRSSSTSPGQADVRRSVARPASSTPPSTWSAPSTCSRARGGPAPARSWSPSSGGTVYGEVRPAQPARQGVACARAPRRRTASSTRVDRSTTCGCTASSTTSSTRRWRWPTCTGLASGRRRGASRPDGHDGAVIATFAARLLAGERVHRPRRRRADPRLRLRRRRGRRVRAGRRPGRRAASSTSAPASRRRSTTCTRRWPPPPASTARPGWPRPGRASSQRSALDAGPGRHPARLAAVDPARRGHRPGPRLAGDRGRVGRRS